MSSPSTALPPPAGGLCLYGGSFDPVHCGHLTLAEAAWRQVRLDRVVFLPCRQSPHKPERPLAAPRHRLAMLREALADVPWAEISTWELDRPGPSYSWETAAWFRANLPAGTSLCWLLGADQWAALDRWARPESLAALLHFIVFPRDDRPVLPRPGFRHTVIEVRHPASSTAVRTAVAQGREIVSQVPPQVAAYIRRHGLYRD